MFESPSNGGSNPEILMQEAAKGVAGIKGLLEVVTKVFGAKEQELLVPSIKSLGKHCEEFLQMQVNHLTEFKSADWGLLKEVVLAGELRHMSLEISDGSRRLGQAFRALEKDLNALCERLKSSGARHPENHELTDRINKGIEKVNSHFSSAEEQFWNARRVVSLARNKAENQLDQKYPSSLFIQDAEPIFAAYIRPDDPLTKTAKALPLTADTDEPRGPASGGALSAAISANYETNGLSNSWSTAQKVTQRQRRKLRSFVLSLQERLESVVEKCGLGNEERDAVGRAVEQGIVGARLRILGAGAARDELLEDQSLLFLKEAKKALILLGEDKRKPIGKILAITAQALGLFDRRDASN